MNAPGMGLGHRVSDGLKPEVTTHSERREHSLTGFVRVIAGLFVVVVLGLIGCTVMFWWNWQIERDEVIRLRGEQQEVVETLKRDMEQLSRASAQLRQEWAALKPEQLTVAASRSHNLFHAMQVYAAQADARTQVLDKLEKHYSGREWLDWPDPERDRYRAYDQARCEAARHHNGLADDLRHLRRVLLAAGVKPSQIPPETEDLPVIPRKLAVFP